MKNRKLYHWCTQCQDIVAKKKNEPLQLLGKNICKCSDTKNWKRLYLK